MAVLKQIWLFEIIRGMLLMCQNTTMRVYGAWIKIYCVLCSKTYNTLHSCHYFPAGSWQAARVARIWETSLLHLKEAPYHEASVSHSDEDVPGGQSSLMGNEASWGPNRQHVPMKDEVTDDIVINKKATPKFLRQTKVTFKARNLSLVKGHHAKMTSIRKHKENGWIHTFKTFQLEGINLKAWIKWQSQIWNPLTHKYMDFTPKSHAGWTPLWSSPVYNIIQFNLSDRNLIMVSPTMYH